MVSNSIKIEVVDSPAGAPNYNIDGGFRAATIEKCIVVGKGTVNGNPTVDIQFKDKDGNDYVAMVTGALIEGIAAAVAGRRLLDSREHPKGDIYDPSN